MKSPILCFGVTAFALGLSVAVSPVSAATGSGFEAKIVVAGEANLAKSDTFPVAIAVVSKDGKAYNGQIDLWANGGEILDGQGAAHCKMLRLRVTDGKAEAKLKLVRGQVANLVRVKATIGAPGDRELLGEAAIAVRIPASYEIVEEETVLTVRSNGVDRPRLAVLVKDQFGDPLPDCEVSAICKTVKADIVTRTNSEGIARFDLPSFAPENFRAACQINVGKVCFTYRLVCWTEDGTGAIYGE